MSSYPFKDETRKTSSLHAEQTLRPNVQLSICVKSGRLPGRLLLLSEYNSATVVRLHVYTAWMLISQCLSGTV